MFLILGPSLNNSELVASIDFKKLWESCGFRACGTGGIREVYAGDCEQGLECSYIKNHCGHGHCRPLPSLLPLPLPQGKYGASQANLNVSLDIYWSFQNIIKRLIVPLIFRSR